MDHRFPDEPFLSVNLQFNDSGLVGLGNVNLQFNDSGLVGLGLLGASCSAVRFTAAEEHL